MKKHCVPLYKERPRYTGALCHFLDSRCTRHMTFTHYVACNLSMALSFNYAVVMVSCDCVSDTFSHQTTEFLHHPIIQSLSMVQHQQCSVFINALLVIVRIQHSRLVVCPRRGQREQQTRESRMSEGVKHGSGCVDKIELKAREVGSTSVEEFTYLPSGNKRF